VLDTKLELNYLYEAVPLLDKYLESKELFWQLPGIAREPGFAFGALTIGVVLLMLKRAKGRSLPEKLAAERGDYETRIFQSKIHNEKAWMKKVGQDFTNRARLWEKSLNEYRDDRIAAISSYPTQVSQRVIMQLLWEEQDSSSLLLTPLQFMIQTMDAALKQIFIPGAFIWDPELQPSFPEGTYWYLYGMMNGKAKF
jgi:hypothetical protein